jgi:xylulokinase
MILTVDIGTTAFKAALFSVSGECLRAVSLPLSIDLSDGIRHETDPLRWLGAFEDCLSRLAPLTGVEALGISGNGPSLVPVTGLPSERGMYLPAGSARLWLDRRAGEESALVSTLMDGFVDPGFFLPKALFIKNREPELYGQTKFFLSCPEYLSCALTGVPRTVFPSAGFERWFWNTPVLERLGLDPEKFPAFVSPGSLIGSVFPRLARSLGLTGPGEKREIPVVAAGPDFFAAILGAGALEPGDACDRSGTSEGINLCTRSRVSDPRLMSYGHPVKPYWNLSGIISTTGKALAWARDLLGFGGRPFGDFLGLAESARPGGGGILFLPYLAGERAPIWDPRARGSFLGLSLSTGPAELARSVAEGICFALRDVIAVMEESGVSPGNLRVTGRPGESAFLNQLKADITGKTVLVPAARMDAELAGTAALTAAALGLYPAPENAAAAMVKIERTYQPDRGKASLYAGLFAEYRAAYQSLKENFARLDGLRIP